jgi:hypothetical protein
LQLGQNKDEIYFFEDFFFKNFAVTKNPITFATLFARIALGV